MNLIAIESSTETLSLAVQGRGVLAQRDIQGGAAASRTLLPLLRELLMQAGVAPKDLNAVVFGQGPGSFTGIRTACAVAQGFAYGLGLPVLPVGTLLAVAQGAREAGGGDRIVACLDARMGQVYAAHYLWEEGQWQCLVQPHTVAPDQLDVPEGWRVAGNAFAVYNDQWRDDGAHLWALPSATSLLALAPALLAQGAAVPAAKAMPLYVRDKVALNTAERLAGVRL